MGRITGTWYKAWYRANTGVPGAVVAMSDPGQTFIEPKRTWPLLQLLAAVLPVFGAAALGSVATRPNIPTWYEGLIKPSFTPPNWVFAPVWTVLYILMAYAVLRVFRLSPEPGRCAA